MGLNWGELLRDVVAILIGVSLLHSLYFIALPVRVVKSCGQRRPDWLRRYLECVTATPSLVRPTKIVARQFLVAIYFSRGQHAEAVRHCRAILKSLVGLPIRVRASLEADTRRRLADCLEAIGQTRQPKSVAAPGRLLMKRRQIPCGT
jgi:hypothetical protein